MVSHESSIESSGSDPTLTARRALMLSCAHATIGELEMATAAFPESAGARDLRPPEIGLVMVRGRIGGTGAPFNVGEATVTRATVQLSDQSIGHAYLLGRSRARARLAAIVDALGQDGDRYRKLAELLVEPTRARVESDDESAYRETAATRVDFFTVARGEDLS